MSKNQKIKLSKLYKKYAATQKRKTLVGFLTSFMPEVIFRTTRLEGEKVSRNSVKSLF